MSRDIEIDIVTAFRQAKMTASDYLAEAYEILNKNYTDFGVPEAVALAHIMAMDFNTMVTGLKLQEIRDSLRHRNDDE